MREQSRLTRSDYESLEHSYISREIADRAGIYRVASPDGRDLVGRKGGGDYNGLVFPYRVEGRTVGYRLRLDHPPNDGHGKPDHKYLQAYGERNHIYFPPIQMPLAENDELPVVITEGEKKCLALWRMALETGNGTGEPSFLPISFAGCYSWRGVIGKKNDATGKRVDEKGTIPDLDRIAWKGRRVTILFDTNAATNPQVSHARRDLAAELTKRGAQVWIADLPPEMGINGCDDYLAAHGVAALQSVLDRARQYDWKGHLMRGEKGPYSIMENALIALRNAPEWSGVLAYDEFRMRHMARRPTPWGFTGDWTDTADIEMACWLQRHGMLAAGVRIAADAAFTASKDCTFHPVRDYLNALVWDHEKRLNKWLTEYLGATDDPLAQGIAAAWMISAVARIFEPGSKADHMLVLEGPQGTFKSTALRKLAEPWFTDDMPALSTKDAQIATLGAWIIEMAELEAMGKAEWSKTKAFLSCQIDRFRPPYGRNMIDHPRQCVFAGTINHPTYLSDETGGRRFWPVKCGEIKLDRIVRDRDQLWAEAVHRYRAKEQWWLDKSLEPSVSEAQEERFQADTWESPIAKFLKEKEKYPGKVSVQNVLEYLDKPKKDWGKSDQMRVSKIICRLGWQKGLRDDNVRYYIPKQIANIANNAD